MIFRLSGFIQEWRREPAFGANFSRTPTAIELGGTSVMTTALRRWLRRPLRGCYREPWLLRQFHAIADDRRAALAGVAQSYGDSVTNHAVVAEDGIAADDDSAEVIDPKPAAQLCFAGQSMPVRISERSFRNL